MTVRQLIPEDLAEVAPGPELARVLAGIELSRLSGYDCVEVLKARYRQVNHERARLMATMVEVGLCGIGPDDELPRRAVPDEFSADEVRAALVLTRRAADAQFWLAYDLLTRLPAVHAALDTGALDEPRARVLSEWTTELDPQQARALCDQLLPQAQELTTGQLIEQIKKLAIAVDPEWARRRYEQAVADRKVVGYRNPDGSANLSGLNLPVDRVAAASGHIDTLAKAAKRAGERRPIDHIRADLFLGMTDGTYTGLTDAEIVTQLLAAAPLDESDDKAGHHNDDGSSGDDNNDDDTHGDGGWPDPDPDGPRAGEDQPGGGEPDENGDDGSAAATDQPAPAASSGAGMELRVRLSTLLGHDQHPAELAGWGPVHAELARDLAATLGGAQWRFAITDEHGQLTHCGITRARPATAPTRRAGCRAIMELQVPAVTLHALNEHSTELGAWTDVVADLVRQLERDTAGEDRYVGDAHRRAPGTALRRYLEIRDRHCIMIGCRAPARTADKDHTRDHGYGGPTTDDNLGDACRHDHRLKHEGGWRLHQPQAGHFRWISRLGHSYHRRPPPILEPLPDPISRDRPPYPLRIPLDDGWEDTEIWEDPPPAPEPDLPPEPDPGADIPPF
ncbi:MAG: DUF222 domain-containing protein [Pseudonocardiaceae bacterium]